MLNCFERTLKSGSGQGKVERLLKAWVVGLCQIVRMGFFGFIWFCIVGFLVGVIAKWIVPGDEGLNWWQTALLGIAGSLFGGTLWNLVRGNGLDLQGADSFIGAIIGTVLLILVVNYATTRQLSSSRGKK